MKRIYLLTLLLVCFSAISYGQRTLNLELRHSWSKTGASGTWAQFSTNDTLLINGSNPYWFAYQVVNYGPDTTLSTDSLLLFSSWGTIRGVMNTVTLGVNDTITVQPADAQGNAIPTTLSAGQNVTQSGFQSTNWCDSVSITDGNGNAINDDTLANNFICTQITTLFWLTDVDGTVKKGNEVFLLYPNPATNRMNIKHDFGKNNSARVRVVDVTGKVVHNEELGTLSGVQDVQLNLPRIPSGVYVVQLITAKRTLSKQLYIR